MINALFAPSHYHPPTNRCCQTPEAAPSRPCRVSFAPAAWSLVAPAPVAYDVVGLVAFAGAVLCSMM
jgi:hypothetical protein